MDQSAPALSTTWRVAGDEQRPGGAPIAEALSMTRPIVEYMATAWRVETADQTPSTTMEAARWTLRRTYTLRRVSRAQAGRGSQKEAAERLRAAERLQAAVERLETRFTVPAGLDAGERAELQQIAAKNCIYGLLSQAGPLIEQNASG